VRREERSIFLRADDLHYLGQAEFVRLLEYGWRSHGERRYLEIGISLATEPNVLLLDEPTAGMSCAETNLCAKLIQRLNKTLNLSVVLVEHDMSVVMGISDRVMVLNEGRLLAEGTPTEVSDNEEVQRVYLGESSVC
jgi:branched-chain amino acid transport system ATP-binding protein